MKLIKEGLPQGPAWPIGVEFDCPACGARYAIEAGDVALPSPPPRVVGVTCPNSGTLIMLRDEEGLKLDQALEQIGIARARGK